MKGAKIMINNLKEAMNYFTGRDVTISGWSYTSRSICINGERVELPKSKDELEKIVKKGE